MRFAVFGARLLAIVIAEIREAARAYVEPIRQFVLWLRGDE